MALKPIGKILGSDDFWAEDKEALKYIHHQFQDYGYRLALKLGDLQHKSIYIKLAKTTPRHLIEKAAAFASDFPDEPNKGKLFMWQLKQLRLEQEELDHKEDFSRLFTWQKILQAREQLQQMVLKKESERTGQYLKLIALLKPVIVDIKKGTVLDPLSGLASEVDIWISLGWKYTAWESNKFLIDAATKHKKASTKIVYKKDPFAAISKLKDGTVNILWLPRLWELIAFEAQSDLVTQIRRILKPGGLVVLTTHLDTQSQQQWEFHNVQKDLKVWLYHSKQKLETLQQLFSGFELVQNVPFDAQRTTLVWRLADK